MKPFKTIKRITGISCPMFGVSWNPTDTDRDKIRRLIRFLEDRRVLYTPFHLEMPPWVVQSILEMRKELTNTLGDFEKDEQTAEALFTMRAACRRYLDSIHKSHKTKERYRLDEFEIDKLAELRSVFGLCIGKLSIMYGIDLEDELAEIIPVMEDDGKDIQFDKSSMRVIM